MATPRTAVCTIVCRNYLHYARALIDSLRAVQPDWEPYVLVIDGAGEAFDPGRERFQVVDVAELALPDPQQFLFRYTILELCTAVKPWLLRWLFDQTDAGRVVYLDPDIFVYAPMQGVEEAFDRGAFLVLTPHLTAEIPDRQKPNETDILRAGCYNLGFLALARHAQLPRFLAWWQRNLEFDCRIDFNRGLFVDQKWIDLVPGLFDDIAILRHPGYNVAYWNVVNRCITSDGAGYRVNGEPLVFFHFSGLNPWRPGNLSKHQDRFTLDELVEVRELVFRYCAVLQANGLREFAQLPYAFGSFADGTPVKDVYRLEYRVDAALQRRLGPDPFASGADYFNRKHALSLPLKLLRRLPGAQRLRELAWSVPARRLRQRLRPLCSLVPLGLRRRLKTSLRRALFGEDLSSETVPEPLTPRLYRAFPDGINVVGYVRSEHGLGESARLCARAAHDAGVPFSLYDFTAGNDSRAEDHTWDQHLHRDNSHWVNILHINADQMPLACRTLGPAFFDEHYNIGFWHWELPEFPEAWTKAFALVHEVWAPSWFVVEALTRQAPVPVLRMPHGISIQLGSPLSRADLGLPDGKFLFLSMYDTHSVQERKNPWAAVAAFRRAFPTATDVGLVIKVNNPASRPKEVAALKAELAGVPGIIILDRILTRQDVYQLEALCDCFVSLHRSEGFGLGLAESMLLGKPVIGTHWSGNVDFMNAENSCPVRYRLVPLDRNYGPYPAGSTWADPDLDQAAWFMRELTEKPAWRQLIAARGQETIRTEFSPQAVGQLYRQRLAAIEKASGCTPARSRAA